MALLQTKLFIFLKKKGGNAAALKFLNAVQETRMSGSMGGFFMGGVYAHTCMHTRKRVCVRRRSAHAYHSPPAHLIAPRPHPGVGTTLAPAPTLTLALP